MAKNSAETQAPVTPGDEPSSLAPTPTASLPEKPKRKVPKRGTKKRVLGEGEGDYCIFELVADHPVIPRGSMVPIPGIPRFVDTAKAMKWIRNESEDRLTGKQVMIFKACEILSLQLSTKPTVVIQTKPKVTVTRPETSNG